MEIWSPSGKRAGSGYLVADRLVLTALHNVAGGARELEVRLLDREGRTRWSAAEVLWPEQGQEPDLEREPQADAALIRITDAEWTPPGGAEPVRWGRIEPTVGESQLTCLAVGFPRSEKRDQVRDTKEIRGHVETLTGLKSGGLITAYVDRVATPSKPDGKSRWAGASGAALFARGRLVGVVTTDRARDYEADQLTAVAVASLAARPGFAMAIKASGGEMVLDHVTAVTPAEPPRTAYDIEVPPGVHNLSDLTSRIFVGREEVLAELDRALTEDSQQTITQTLHGLGGVGKTTLAWHYAHDHLGSYRLVWWIRSDTPELIDAGLAALAARLRGDADALATAQAVSWAIGWLQTHPGWLLVFDNVEKPEDVRAITGQLRDYGRQLITSRCKGGWAGEAIPLPVLDIEASLDLLARLTDGGDEDEARELAEELGHLPLALQQAGAFIAQASITVDEYRRMLHQHPEDATGAAPPDADPTRTMASVWRISLDALHERDPRAVEILRIAAWYAPTGIPRSLFAPLAENPVDLAGLLALLANYNMITLDRTSLGAHRLVQMVARTPSGADPHRSQALITAARDQAAAWILDALPDDPVSNVQGWPRWRSLLPHAEALLKALSPAEDTVDTVTVLNEVGTYLEGQGEVRKATEYCHRALEAATRVLGADHPNTLAARNNLAGAYESAGDVGRAIPLYEQTLADCLRVLGADHPSTLRSRSNLAYVYEAAGDARRAIPVFEQTLADCLRVLGADHPDTLRSRSNLAGAYESAGDVGRSISLYEQVLADRLRVLGADHPDTLTSRSNLAYTYATAGDVERAIPLYEQTLADRLRVLGADHPDTLASRSSLAGAYALAGDVGRVIPLYEQTLADRLRVLGADHPDTLASRSNLAYAFKSAGDVGRAIPLYEQTLADRLRVLGADHPDTLTLRNNLASAYTSVGDVGRAVPLYEQTLADCVRVLGQDHPTTKAVRGNLAAARAVASLPTDSPGRQAPPSAARPPHTAP
ncbi:tetratricopeptide repeat protein [Streptomyces sp. NPDC059037]|uniref:tetratricopeptide repeat protein n=1 Tax=Streptomyces sp. NPDC059037 TaxID=3346710 RepID=UPI00368AB6A8